MVVLGAIRDAGQGQRTADQLGMKMPAMGTSPAKAVGKAVVAAIEKDRAEIVVMPGPGRLIKALMDLFPSMGPAMNRAAGANATMRKVKEFRKQSSARSESQVPAAFRWRRRSSNGSTTALHSSGRWQGRECRRALHDEDLDLEDFSFPSPPLSGSSARPIGPS